MWFAFSHSGSMVLSVEIEHNLWGEVLQYLSNGYIPHDNIHEINTWKCPIHSVVIWQLYPKYSIGGVNMGE